jgi:hypothetical protein
MRRLAALLVTLLAPAAFANGLPQGPIVKPARAGDRATEYELRADGGLYRKISGHTCQVASDVEDFEIAAHPRDAAVAYFVRGGGLYGLPPARPWAACPRAVAALVIPRLGELGFRLVSSAKSRVLGFAVDDAATLHILAGPGADAVVIPEVADLALNPCFGQKRKAFASYVAFALGKSGYVVKIDGSDPSASKPDGTRPYRSLREFTRLNRVCR